MNLLLGKFVFLIVAHESLKEIWFVESNATKKHPHSYRVLQMPDILLVHLKRFNSNRVWRDKVRVSTNLCQTSLTDWYANSNPCRVTRPHRFLCQSGKFDGFTQVQLSCNCRRQSRPKVVFMIYMLYRIILVPLLVAITLLFAAIWTTANGCSTRKIWFWIIFIRYNFDDSRVSSASSKVELKSNCLKYLLILVGRDCIFVLRLVFLQKVSSCQARWRASCWTQANWCQSAATFSESICCFWLAWYFFTKQAQQCKAHDR